MFVKEIMNALNWISTGLGGNSKLLKGVSLVNCYSDINAVHHSDERSANLFSIFRRIMKIRYNLQRPIIKKNAFAM